MSTLVACPTCALVQRLGTVPPGHRARCVRCDATLHRRKPHSLSRTAALALAALLLYAPANAYPIIRMHFLGTWSESTIWDGVVALARNGMWLVAGIVFLASILVPLVKLLGLLYLVTTAHSVSRRRDRTRVFRFIEAIGPWAMLDVFLLAVLVAVVKLGDFATVLPGPGLLAFAAVVVLTILASASFDARLIWDPPGARP